MFYIHYCYQGGGTQRRGGTSWACHIYLRPATIQTTRASKEADGAISYATRIYHTSTLAFNPDPEEAMASIYRATNVSLHVRKSNRAALSLYQDTLGFTVKDIEKGYCECYYAQGLQGIENCLQMRMGRTLMRCASIFSHEIMHMSPSCFLIHYPSP